MAKSFSIKIGADTQEFLKGLREANKEINSTQKNAQALDKSLEFDFNKDKAILAQQQYQKALEKTEEKADSIRNQLKLLEESGRVNTTDYERLQTELINAEVQASKLKQSIEEIKDINVERIADKFSEVGAKIEGAGKKLAPFSAAAAGAIVGAVKLAKDAVEVGDEIATLSTQYDMSAKAIQRWQYVAMQTDVESGTLLKSIQKTQAAFGEQATGGTTAAVKALETLGLSYENFNSNEEMFQAVIDSLSAIDDKTLQAAYATDILGERYASSLVPLLQSKEAISGYISEFEQVGYLSDEVVNQLGELDNQVNKVTAQWELAKVQLGVAMIPIYEKLIAILEEKVIPAIEKLSNWFNSLSPSTQSAIFGLLGVIAVAAPLLILIGKMTTGIGGLIKLFGTMKAASFATAAGVAALAGALFLGLDLINNWKNMSTIEKVLKSLAVAALVAAAAVTVFHASWSVGIAIGAITAGIVAGIAAIKAAAKNIGVETDFESIEMPTSSDYGMTEKELSDINSWSSKPTSGAVSNNYQTAEDNSTNTFNIYIEANEYVSAEEVADIVSKKIATLSKARG